MTKSREKILRVTSVLVVFESTCNRSKRTLIKIIFRPGYSAKHKIRTIASHAAWYLSVYACVGHGSDRAETDESIVRYVDSWGNN